MCQVFAVFGALVSFLLVCCLRSCLLHGGMRPFWREGRASCGFAGRDLTIHGFTARAGSSQERPPTSIKGQDTKCESGVDVLTENQSIWGGEDSVNGLTIPPGLVSLPSRLSA